MSTRDDDNDLAVQAAADWAGQDFSTITPPDPDEQRQLLARLPQADPNAPVMISRSLRISTDMERQIKAAARAEGVTASEFIRRAVERALTGADSRQISLDAAIRVLERLPRAV
jgi:predicted DNA-binding protein